MADEGNGTSEDIDEWEADRLMDLVSHDLINQQQAALGFLELLEDSEGLSDGERALVARTVEVLEHTARLLLQVRTTMVHRERGEYRPSLVPLDRALISAARSVQGAYARDRLTIDTVGIEGGPRVMADAVLGEMLTQLLLLLSETAPADRDCTMRVAVEPRGERTAIRVSSEGFALNPMVSEALVGGREPLGRSSEVTAITLVQHLLRQYGGSASMEDAPAGEVGAYMVIELPSGEGTDAVDNDSR
ncbi:MAG: hypothetical protein JSW25_04960 [Thermoplasmata archaeon]|nr:MAG: hypothetical protein JSW25_04960 [Thermoplasmata archaeon]